MSTVTVEVDVGEVLDQLSDKELLAEVKERGLGATAEALSLDRRDDLVRALEHRDWPEVEYLLRTYFLGNEARFVGVVSLPRLALQ